MLTAEQRQKNLEELKKYKVVLNRDPSVSGLSICYSQVAELEEYKNRVSDILADAISDLFNAKKMVVDSKATYEMEFNKKSIEDTIKILKSADQRSAAVNVLLTNYLRGISASELELLSATNFHNRVQLVYSELSDKIEAIKQQVNIYNTMYRKGEFVQEKIPHHDKIRIGLEG